MKSTPIISIFLAVLLTVTACKLLRPVDSAEKPPTPPGTAQFDYWIHGPLHPGNQKAVTFESKVKEPLGLQSAELYIYEHELFLNEDKLPSKRRRTNGQWGKVKSWALNGETNSKLSYTWTKGFPKASQIEYVFKVMDIEGKTTERVALFDAGTSLWPTDKILLYSPTREPLTQTFNLCFFPDVDFKRNWAAFLKDTRSLIFDGFHPSNVMADRKERWTFFYTQQEADGLNIALDFVNPDHYPPFMKDELITGIDAFALLHKTEYSDGSYLYGNIHFLAQNVFTSESYNHGTAIHEMGHSVFQLSDEYNGCACFEPTEGFSNVYSNLDDCLTFHKENGQPNGHCHEFYGYDGKLWFTPEEYVHFPTREACIDYNKSKGYTEQNCITFIDVDGQTTYRAEEGVCIMTDDGDNKAYPFQSSCLAVINDYYSRFGDKFYATSGSANEVHENMFGYEPVVYLALGEANGKWTADVQKIGYGIPIKTNRKGNSAELFFLDNSDKVTYQLQIDRPGEGHFCGGEFGGQNKVLAEAKCLIAVPYSSGLSELLVNSHPFSDKDPNVKGSNQQRIDLTKELEKAAKLFKPKK